ncbi:MAG: NAD(P)H-dependent oxidoreductase [bacterium]
MKTLIILAHPSKYGFSRRIANEYAKGAKEKGMEVEILDLYQDENKQDFLIFDDIKSVPPDPSVTRMQEKITAADELVFAFPLWWFAEPAVLKNFWDKNMTTHYAYQYVSGKPVGLLLGKTARVFVTSDGSKMIHWLLLNPVKTIWWLARLRFCGIQMKSFVLFDDMFKRSEANKSNQLKKVFEIAKN